jgi:hypothetical protein
MAAFSHGSITSRCRVPIDGINEIITWIPGQNATGNLRPDASRVGKRCVSITGVEFELRGETTGVTPEDDLFLAMGMPRSSHTIALGDYHVSGETPSGDLVRLATAALFIDGTKWPLENLVCSGVWRFVNGMIPTVTVDMLGMMPASGPTNSTSIETTASVPAVTVGVLGLPWIGSTITLGGVGLSSTVGPVMSIEVNIGNRMVPREAAGGKFGYGPPDVTGQVVTGSILFEHPTRATYAAADKVIAGTTQVLGWTYVAAGATFMTHTYTMNIIPQSMAERRDVDGRLCLALNFCQDPTTGLFQFIYST